MEKKIYHGKSKVWTATLRGSLTDTFLGSTKQKLLFHQVFMTVGDVALLAVAPVVVASHRVVYALGAAPPLLTMVEVTVGQYSLHFET